MCTPEGRRMPAGAGIRGEYVQRWKSEEEEKREEVEEFGEGWEENV